MDLLGRGSQIVGGPLIGSINLFSPHPSTHTHSKPQSSTGRGIVPWFSKAWLITVEDSPIFVWDDLERPMMVGSLETKTHHFLH